MKKSLWKADSFIRTGLRHLDKSQPCQDYVIVDGVKGAALCDGVSRSIESEKASEIGAKQTITVCKNIIGDKLLLKDLVSKTERSKSACEAIAEDICKRIQTKLSDYPKADSTLAFVYRLDDRYAILGYIGDSAIIVISESKAEVFTQTRDYGGPTESIAHPRASELMDIRIVDMDAENVKAFVLTSDGLEEELYTKGNKARALKSCEKYVNALFESDGHTAIENLLDDVTADGLFDDDISLAVLAREEISLPEEPQWLCSCGHRNTLTTTYCEKCDKDYFTLYRNADMSNYPSPWEYFSYLNAHPKEEQRVIGYCAKDKADSQVIVFQRKDSSVHDSEEFKESHYESKTERDNDEYRHNEKQSHVKKGEETSSMIIPKRFAIIGSAIAVLLCGILVVNFFQILSISNNLESMRKEIDSIKSNSTEQIAPTTEHIATPSESAPTKVTPSVEETYEESTISTQKPSEAIGKIMLSVSETTTLYPTPEYSEHAIGYATKENQIMLEEKRTVNDVEWFKVITSTHITGWAPSEFFEIDESN